MMTFYRAKRVIESGGQFGYLDGWHALSLYEGRGRAGRAPSCRFKNLVLRCSGRDHERRERRENRRTKKKAEKFGAEKLKGDNKITKKNRRFPGYTRINKNGAIGLIRAYPRKPRL